MPRTKYIWDDENILMEKDEFGVTQKTYTLEPQVYGNLVSEFDGTDTLHHHYDALGATRQLTDQNGELTDDYTYDAWGNLIAHTGTSQTAFLWIGEIGYYWDAETGQYAVRARILRSDIARWLSTDPVGFLEGLNRYWYVSNRPTNAVDPSGLQSEFGEIDTRIPPDDPILPDPFLPVWPNVVGPLIIQWTDDFGLGQALLQLLRLGPCGDARASLTGTVAGPVIRDGWGCVLLNKWLFSDKNIIERVAGRMNAVLPVFASSTWGECPLRQRCCGFAFADLSATLKLRAKYTVAACTFTFGMTFVGKATGAVGVCVPRNCACPPSLPPKRSDTTIDLTRFGAINLKAFEPE